jgi:hypothetical protein
MSTRTIGATLAPSAQRRAASSSGGIAALLLGCLLSRVETVWMHNPVSSGKSFGPDRQPNFILQYQYLIASRQGLRCALARTIGPRAARSTLRSVALFCRVLGQAFGNIVANLATSFGATGTSNFGRPRLRRTAPRFRRSAQPSESGPLRRAVRLTTGTTADPPAGACPMARYEPIWTGADS